MSVFSEQRSLTVIQSSRIFLKKSVKNISNRFHSSYLTDSKPDTLFTLLFLNYFLFFSKLRVVHIDPIRSSLCSKEANRSPFSLLSNSDNDARRRNETFV